MDFTHTTAPAQSGAYHYFEVRGPNGAVSLSLLHSQHPGFAVLGDLSPRAASRLVATDSGHWVFDVIQSHQPVAEDSPYACPRHGLTCEMDAFVSRVADPIWRHLRQVGVADASVRGQLEPLLAATFGVVPA